jgi:tRNA (guanine37-N1)-methyltransferase
MNFHIITLFPEIFKSYLDASILARAQKEKKIKFSFYNPRDFVKPAGAQKRKEKPYLRVDNKPYGGGPGMVIEALPIVKAIEKILKKTSPKTTLIIFFSPDGKQFNTGYAKKISKKYTDIIMICGRYEGVDARVKKIFKMESVSVGPYVLTGGELPAEILIDCISRQIGGVLGNFDSLEETRAASPEVYTRPEVFKYKGKKYRVPKILLSGNHAKITEWRNEKSNR